MNLKWSPCQEAVRYIHFLLKCALSGQTFSVFKERIMRSQVSSVNSEAQCQDVKLAGTINRFASPL